ncbi:MAG: hypothetical protein WBP41_11105, partial [Saprospiraceae bacterium]
MDEDQSRPDQALFYLCFLRHLWLSICPLPRHGFLAEYPEICFYGDKEVFVGVTSSTFSIEANIVDILNRNIGFGKITVTNG